MSDSYFKREEQCLKTMESFGAMRNKTHEIIKWAQYNFNKQEDREHRDTINNKTHEFAEGIAKNIATGLLKVQKDIYEIFDEQDRELEELSREITALSSVSVDFLPFCCMVVNR
eukprot:GEZU01011277.1.p1 GENE.GEZU01011277.1~~GEZU01011277.1.p1  ORF type:complete len:114 (+),score=13.53 GEZU01011277.1:88-429(+)